MPETEEMAISTLPFFHDGKKSEYLAKRICNFSMREACQLAEVSEKSVRRWREADPTFNQLDTEGMTDLRKKFANEFVDLEFTRNFHLVLQKDFKILYKDATDSKNLTEDDKEYLLKIRQHYTPQALAMVKQILGGGDPKQPFDFTKLTMTIKREREQIEITQE